MSRDRQGWFSDVDNEDGVGEYRWQPCLQLDGWCPSMPAWFRSKEECDAFIRDEIIGKEMLPND